MDRHEWRSISISSLGRIVTGKTPTSTRPELFGDQFPFITPSDLAFDRPHVVTERYLSPAGRESQKNLLLPTQTVCFTCIGATIGKLCVTVAPSFTNQQINSVIVNGAEHDSWFVYYLLRRHGNAIASIAGGAATPIVNKTTFSGFEVTVPPRPTQHKIASILSAYDDLIENNTRRIAILEEMAQAIYREWFVHFRFPGHETVQLVDSPLGKIPMGWDVKPARHVVEIRYGKNLPKTKILSEGKYPVYGAGSVIGFNDFAIVEGRVALVTCRGNGSGTIWRTRESAFVTNNSLMITPKPEQESWSFGFIELHLKYSNVAGVISGSAQPQITIDGLSTVLMLVPSKSIVADFCYQIDVMNDEVDCLYGKNRNLRTTRDLLLPKLISGQLDVEDLDIDVGPIADELEHMTV